MFGHGGYFSSIWLGLDWILNAGDGAMWADVVAKAVMLLCAHGILLAFRKWKFESMQVCLEGIAIRESFCGCLGKEAGWLCGIEVTVTGEEIWDWKFRNGFRETVGREEGCDCKCDCTESPVTLLGCCDWVVRCWDFCGDMACVSPLCSAIYFFLLSIFEAFFRYSCKVYCIKMIRHRYFCCF